MVSPSKTVQRQSSIRKLKFTNSNSWQIWIRFQFINWKIVLIDTAAADSVFSTLNSLSVTSISMEVFFQGMAGFLQELEKIRSRLFAIYDHSVSSFGICSNAPDFAANGLRMRSHISGNWRRSDRRPATTLQSFGDEVRTKQVWLGIRKGQHMIT